MKSQFSSIFGYSILKNEDSVHFPLPLWSTDRNDASNQHEDVYITPGFSSGEGELFLNRLLTCLHPAEINLRLASRKDSIPIYLPCHFSGTLSNPPHREDRKKETRNTNNKNKVVSGFGFKIKS